jgi:hypothetical protein
MILLQRVRTIEAVAPSFRGKGKQKREKTLLQEYRQAQLTPDAKLAFDASFWKAAKSQLKSESGGKCAYCEAPTDVVAHGDVEHFRPKSIYWWLAYNYDNYLFSCQICNQTFKSDRFPKQKNIFLGPQIKANTTDADLDALLNQFSTDPIEIGAGYTLKQFQKDSLAEKPLLINPYFTDPSKYFAYEADTVLKEVTIKALKPKYEPMVRAAIDCFGLNRLEIKQLRYGVYHTFMCLKRSIKAIESDPQLVADIEEQLVQMQSLKSPFAGMNRYFGATTR